MKPFKTILIAIAFASTATLAVAQSDPHHPAADASGDAPISAEPAPEAAVEPESQKPQPDAACPNVPSMMMDMMMGGDEAGMPMMQMMRMMQMMQGTQLEMMRTMATMQEQTALMQRRLEDLGRPGEASP